MQNSSNGSAVTRTEAQDRQYGDSRKLEARANLHRRYGRGGTNWFAWIAEHAALPAGSSVLDLGCGPGWLWENAKECFPPGLHLTLADLSPGMVDEAVHRAKATNCYASVDGQVADAAALPFADESFDAVLACHMLYHVSDVRVALEEMRRVLRPGGVVFVTTNLEGNMAPFYALVAEAFGGRASDPAADIFGLARARNYMAEMFSDVTLVETSDDLHVTSVEDLVLALTSFPPGDGADDAAVARLEGDVRAAMDNGGGTIVIPKTQGMVRGRKG